MVGTVNGTDTVNGVADGSVRKMAVYQDRLYLSGYFFTLGDKRTAAKYITSYNGSAWIALPNGGLPSWATAFAVFNDTL